MMQDQHHIQDPNDDPFARIVELRRRINQILFTTGLSGAMTYFDEQHGRILPIEELSGYKMPIDTMNWKGSEKRPGIPCEVNMRIAQQFLAACGCICESNDRMRAPSEGLLYVPVYGQAALAWLLEHIPAVSTGAPCFVRLLNFLPACDYDYQEFANDSNYEQLGAGIVILKSLFEGLLCFGGDWFPRDKMTPVRWAADSIFLAETLSKALEIQRQVIHGLTYELTAK